MKKILFFIPVLVFSLLAIPVTGFAATTPNICSSIGGHWSGYVQNMVPMDFYIDRLTPTGRGSYSFKGAITLFGITSPGRGYCDNRKQFLQFEYKLLDKSKREGQQTTFRVTNFGSLKAGTMKISEGMYGTLIKK